MIRLPGGRMVRDDAVRSGADRRRRGAVFGRRTTERLGRVPEGWSSARTGGPWCRQRQCVAPVEYPIRPASDLLRHGEDAEDGRDGPRVGIGRLRRSRGSRQGDRDGPGEQPVRDAHGASPRPERLRLPDPGPRAARVVVAGRGEQPERDGLGRVSAWESERRLDEGTRRGRRRTEWDQPTWSMIPKPVSAFIHVTGP